MTSSTGAPLVGALLADRYALETHLARGGMSDVYQATDQVLHRQVAVKVYRAGAMSDRARFDAEVRVLAGLNHPGLVQVFDAGEHAGDGYVVLELVDGPTLRAVLAERGSLPPGECARLGAEVADALAYIHERGVVHRDVNPSNVLCGPDGRSRLADFGIARLIDTTRITAPVDAIGTAPYMAPEQVRGEDVTPAADVYAMGLMVAELLTGAAVFTGPAHEAAMARLAHDPDLTGILGPWRELVEDMTRREPSDRPTAEHVRDRLAALVGATTPAVAVSVASTAGGALAARAAGADPLAETAALAATPAGPSGGTTVMPAALTPDAARPAPGGPGSTSDQLPPGSRRGLWLALAAVAALVLIGIAASGDGLSIPDAATTTTTPTSEPVAVTTPVTEAPTTTAPPAPPEEEDDEGEGRGKGNGNGKKDD